MQKKICISNRTNEKYRYCVEESGEIFVYAKNRSRYGYRYSADYFYSHYTPLESKIDIEKQRQRKLDTIISRLEKSGLWTDLLIKFKNMKLYTEQERLRLYDLYWQDTDLCIKDAKEKYPFMVHKNKDGKDYIDTNYIWEISQLKTKSMYFGKWYNKRVKENIKDALQNKKSYRFNNTVNYDVSFEYNPEIKKAWYSEEYRGCGNGHYYLALDESIALFCEDD